MSEWLVIVGKTIVYTGTFEGADEAFNIHSTGQQPVILCKVMDWN